MIKIAPSILSADFSKLGDEVALLEKAGADWLHFDVMDGHYVPNITFGPMICKAVRARTALTLDVHLMVARPSEWVGPFVDAGADSITFHVEAETHIQRLLARIREMGVKAGVVLNPATPLCTLEYVLEYCDLVLLMCVNPGFGGQKFLPEMPAKIEALRKMVEARGLSLEIEVDGGIAPGTAQLAINAGATVLVAGNAVFSGEGPLKTVKALREV